MNSLFRMASAAAVVLASLLSVGAMAGGTVIDNPAEAPQHETWNLRERWRCGADDTDVLLGRVQQVAVGSTGEIYALDNQLAQVQVFGPDGEHHRTLGREGDGPGEFRQPIGLFWNAAGDLAVVQAFPGLIAYIDAQDGTPRGSWELGKNNPEAGGFGFVSSAQQRAGTFVVAATSSSFDMNTQEIRNTRFLAIVGDDGLEVSRLSEVQATQSMIAFTIDELANHNPASPGLWDVGPKGHVYFVPQYDAYRIAVHGADGAPVREIIRPYEARLRTEAEKEEQRGSMSININGREPDITWKLQDRAPAIDQLQVLDDGTLWVRDSHGATDWPEGRQTWSVFGADGNLQKEVTIDVPEGGDGDRLVLLNDGRVMLIKGLDSVSISVVAGNGGHEDDLPGEELGDTLLELICYDVVQ